ncbi:hypothetical protein [Burkholderia alba]|uniref:hypothetical protein n=1 Tax=Burkholderia alba TaxID=2683677 RepID=UPI002B053761|nr:hypothetical protein [Burkholderia alba]
MKLGTESNHSYVHTSLTSDTSSKCSADISGASDSITLAKIKNPNPQEAIFSELKSNGTYSNRDVDRCCFDIPNKGKTHTSEHVIAFAVLKGPKGPSRNPEDPARKEEKEAARKIENKGLAYYERREDHENHAGTGVWPSKRKFKGNFLDKFDKSKYSGFKSSENFLNSQRTALFDPETVKCTNLSNAIQLNQLGYAHQYAAQNRQSESFDKQDNENHQANSSYDNMIEQNPEFIAKDDKGQSDVKFKMTPQEQAEVYLARRVAQTGRYPIVEEEKDAKRRFSVK